MASKKQNTDEPDAAPADAGDVEAALASSQEKADAELDQGFRGDKADPRPNEDYSLESGPDSPSAQAAAHAAAQQAAGDNGEDR